MERALVHVSPTVTAMDLAQLGERLSSLRLRPPETLREMERSLSRHGFDACQK